MDPQRALAARVAARAQMLDVRLLSTTGSVQGAHDLSRPLQYNLNVDSNFEWNEGESVFMVTCTYEVKLTQATEDEEPKLEEFAAATFVYGALFALNLREDDAAPSPDEFAAYTATTGLFALYPYAREYVRDLTGRMGLPPLTLGVQLQPVTNPAAPQASEQTAGEEVADGEPEGLS